MRRSLLCSMRAQRSFAAASLLARAMADKRIATQEAPVGPSSRSSKRSKRQVTYSTFLRWQTEKEKEHQTMSWLRCDKDSKKYVEQLWCATCRQFEDKIRRVKNFSPAWINGSSNQKVSNVVDHAKSDQHKLSMTLLRTQRAKAMNKPLTSYAPVAKSLLVMDKALEKKMGKKFDICFALAKENLAFRKYPAIHELEIRHGVELGQSYVTKDSARSFTNFIAETQRKAFFSVFVYSPFL